MRRTKLTAILGLAVLTISLSLGTLSVASAGYEYSVWEWWTDKAKDFNTGTTPIPPPWGGAYSSGYTTANLWSFMGGAGQDNAKQLETWTVPTSLWNQGYTELQIEYAGWNGTNTFGWYQPVGQSAPPPTTMTELFNGVDTIGATDTISLTAGQNFGFYLSGKDGAWYSEDELNAVGTGGQRQVRVFEDPRFEPGYGWILCWEDQKADKSGFDYSNAWSSDASLNWSNGPEPDYQDMIVSFYFQTKDNEPPPSRTPELSTWLLLGLSLAAVPVLRRRRRS